VADGVEHVRLFRPDGFAFETNVFRQLFVPAFKRVGREQQVDLPIHTIDNHVNKKAPSAALVHTWHSVSCVSRRVRGGRCYWCSS
jgi:hypothetical protein